MKDTPDHIVVNRARGEMLTHSASKIHIRDLEPVISDEPPSRGGGNLGPSPLKTMTAEFADCLRQRLAEAG